MNPLCNCVGREMNFHRRSWVRALGQLLCVKMHPTILVHMEIEINEKVTHRVNYQTSISQDCYRKQNTFGLYFNNKQCLHGIKPKNTITPKMLAMLHSTYTWPWHARDRTMEIISKKKKKKEVWYASFVVNIKTETQNCADSRYFCFLIRSLCFAVNLHFNINLYLTASVAHST